MWVVGKEDCGSEVGKIHLFLPQAWETHPTVMTHMAHMTTLGPLIIILLIHWEVVKWISRLLVGVVMSLVKRIVAQKLEKFTCFCPEPGKIIQQ